MYIYLYHSSAEKNRINKTEYLSEPYILSGSLRGECSIVTPTIEVVNITPTLVSALKWDNINVISNTNQVQVRTWGQVGVISNSANVQSNGQNVTHYNQTDNRTNVRYFGETKELGNIISNGKKVQFTNEKISTSFNYAYIPEFNRYYFIDDIVSVNSKLWRISMTCDVLMSYRNEILSLPAFVTRNQFIYNNYLDDDRFPLRINRNEVNKYYYTNLNEFNTDKNNCNVLLTVNSGFNAFLRGNIQLPFPLNSISGIEMGAGDGYTIYVLSTTNFMNMIPVIWKNENLLSGILSCIFLPYSIDCSGYELSTVHINGSPIEVSSTYPIMGYALSNYANRNLVQQALVRISSRIKLNSRFKSYLDYSKYSNYSIYIPYLGWKELNAVDILDNDLQLIYTINAYTGSSTVYLIAYSDNEISSQTLRVTAGGNLVHSNGKYVTAEVQIADNDYRLLVQEECQLGIKYTFSTTNAQTLNDQRLQLSTNMIVSGLNSFSSIAGGVANATMGNASGAISGIMGGVTGLIGDSLKTITALETQHVYSSCSPSSGQDGLLAPQYIIIKELYPNPLLQSDAEINEYLSLNGKPLYETHILSELSGYTEINNIHLDNISNATLSELDMIGKALYSGFII